MSGITHILVTEPRVARDGIPSLYTCLQITNHENAHPPLDPDLIPVIAVFSTTPFMMYLFCCADAVSFSFSFVSASPFFFPLLQVLLRILHLFIICHRCLHHSLFCIAIHLLLSSF